MVLATVPPPEVGGTKVVARQCRAAWPSGLGKGLQSPVQRFDSARRLESPCGAVRHIERSGDVTMPRGRASEVTLTLDTVELFSECSQRELQAVAALCTRLDVAAGSVLTRQGTRDPECFVVGSGSAAVEIDLR